MATKKKAITKKSPEPQQPPAIAVAESASAIVESTSRTRPLDGSQNNRAEHGWGAAGSTLLRLTPPRPEGHHFSCSEASKSSMVTEPAHPRDISNAVCAETTPIDDPAGRTHWMWAWGQFLDHQLDLTVEQSEAISVDVAADDPFLDADSQGVGATMHFGRSRMAAGTGVRHDVGREHANELSAYIDGSSVYGNDPDRLEAMLEPGGSPKLATSGANLLPLNPDPDRFANARAGGFDGDLFLAGDVRANEHVVLTSLHTAFMRLHNLRVDALAASEADPVRLFTRARAWVAAVMQYITYEEFLPALLGDRLAGLGWRYDGYQPSVETTISTEFSTAAYRLGHSMLPGEIPVTRQVPSSKTVSGQLRLPLEHAFFQPALLNTHGTDVFLDGLHTEAMRKVDPTVVDGLRNFLFRFPGGPGGLDLGLLDLAALNIMRGRDHCIGTYNDVREGLGLSRRSSFDEITGDSDVAAGLGDVYDCADDVDLWVGGLCERAVSGSVVGETFHAILLDQFVRLRDGDRWHYQNPDYPRFGQAVGCCPRCDASAKPGGAAVLTDAELSELNEGVWSLARVLRATESVSSDAFGDDQDVFFFWIKAPPEAVPRRYRRPWAPPCPATREAAESGQAKSGSSHQGNQSGRSCDGLSV